MHDARFDRRADSRRATAEPQPSFAPSILVGRRRVGTLVPARSPRAARVRSISERRRARRAVRHAESRAERGGANAREPRSHLPRGSGLLPPPVASIALLAAYVANAIQARLPTVAVLAHFQPIVPAHGRCGGQRADRAMPHGTPCTADIRCDSARREARGARSARRRIPRAPRHRHGRPGARLIHEREIDSPRRTTIEIPVSAYPMNEWDSARMLRCMSSKLPAFLPVPGSM